MKNYKSTVGWTLLPFTALLALTMGCETSSHHSKHEYQYDSDPGYSQRDSRSDSRYRSDQPPPPPPRRQAKEDELTEEYQMVSPGQMVVDPK